MIKNLLYSLFLHFLLLLAIYANFNLKNSEENKTHEITVSLMPFDGSNKTIELKPENVVTEKEPEKIAEKAEKKPPIKEDKAPKPSPKNKISQELRKHEKPREHKAINKTPIESKIQEFKPNEKIDEKEKPAETKKDEVKNDGQEAKEDEKNKKEKDLGAKEQAPEKQEVNEKKSANEVSAADLANSIDNLDLSAREKFNIQSQLHRCYKKAVDENKMKSDVKIFIKANIAENGYIDSNIDDIIDMKRYNDSSETSYKIAIDNARRAIDLCNPLRNLPLDKYYVWKEVLLQFDEGL